ncbi:MAG: sel1 repeat family protein [Pseudomonadota bacterium]
MTTARILGLWVVGLACALSGSVAGAREYTGNDLSYESFIDSNKRIKCLYGYAAEKTGDHEAARLIFEDCIRRWQDVYSMIWLADLYENGLGVPRDLHRATALMKQGAESDGQGGYAALARYHYGVALYEGHGTPRNPDEGRRWLQRAAEEGVANAASYLRAIMADR